MVNGLHGFRMVRLKVKSITKRAFLWVRGNIGILTEPFKKLRAMIREYSDKGSKSYPGLGIKGYTP